MPGNTPPPPPLHCAACGYDIRGLPSAVCPECGNDLRRVGLAEDSDGRVPEFGNLAIYYLILAGVGGIFFVGIASSLLGSTGTVVVGFLYAAVSLFGLRILYLGWAARERLNAHARRRRLHFQKALRSPSDADEA